MEISQNLDNILKAYDKFSIDNIQDIENTSTSFIDKYVHKMRQDTENMLCEFLEENGYKIDKPYNTEQLNQIKKGLEKEDKFIDILEYTDYDFKNCEVIRYMKPFFNSISCPLSDTNREFLIERWKELNETGK